MQTELLKVLISEVIKQFTLPIYNGLKKITKDAYNRIQVSFDLCFSEYLERNYERYSKTKTLLYREVPVNIKDFYVRTDLIINKKIVDEKKFINEVKKNKRLIILGSAGCGKSTFCKSIFIELIEQPVGIFPIFIELRHLNNSSDKSIYNFILNSMTAISSSFKKEQLDYALKLGKVLVILDGFDEVNSEDRENIEKEILYLSNNYHGVKILLSSRFDSRFSSWEEFYQYGILELDKNKALTLVHKLDYDRQVKNSFLRELDKKLYESHSSFASNPLLLTMMLLTYEQIAEIPNKIHLFYEQAFLTLFNKHDSLKSMYKRKSFSQLPLDDFKRCLEAFCILSYSGRSYSFSENEINKYLDNSINISRVTTNSKFFLNDLLDSVCILQRDGLGFNFTHRSFQEYFSAQFLVNIISANKYDLFEKVFNISSQDNVISMVYDINPSLLEKEWIIKKINKINMDISSLYSYENYELLIFQKVYSSISVYYNYDIDKEMIIFDAGGVEKYNYFFSFIRDLYNESYLEYSLNKKVTTNKDASILKKNLLIILDVMVI
ncbi:NACHT domain-containing protein [Acinetobacter baumannii]